MARNSVVRSDFLLNLLVFVPFGLLGKLLIIKGKERKLILRAGFISLLFESLQYLFQLGASDITDLISNTLGAEIGLLAYHFFLIFWKREESFQCCIFWGALISGGLLFGGLLLLLSLNA